MSTPIFVCPGCQAHLRPSRPLAPGQVMCCPKCSVRFRPAAHKTPPPPREKAAVEVRPPRRTRPDLDEDLPVTEPRKRRPDREDEPQEKPRPRRQEKPAANANLVWILGGVGAGGLLLLVGAVVMALVLMPRKQSSVAQVPNQPPPGQPGGGDPFGFPAGGPPQPPAVRGSEDAEWVDGTQAEPPVALGKDRPWLVLDAGGHTAQVRGVLLTPDGKHLVTISKDKTIRVWDVGSGEPLRVLRLPIGVGLAGMLWSAALSPDGKRLAVSGVPVKPGDQEAPIYLLDLEKGRVERVLKGHRDIVARLDFSRDGTHLASASTDKTARIYDVRSGETKHILTGHTDALLCGRFSPDGSRFATGSVDKSVRLFTTSDGKCEHVLRHPDRVDGIAWTANGDSVVTACKDGFLRVYARDGQLRKTIDTSEGESKNVWLSSVAVSPAGEAIYCGLTDVARVGIFDLATGKRRLRFNRHDNTVHDLSLSADGALAVTTGGNDHDIFIWKTDDGRVVQHLRGLGRTTLSVGWSVDGKSLSWSTNNRGEPGPRKAERAIRLTDFEPVSIAPGEARGARLTAGAYTLRQTDDFTIQVTANGKLVGTFTSPLKGEQLISMTMVPGNRAVIGGLVGLYLLDLRDGKVIREFIGHSGVTVSLAPSPDGRYFVSGCSDQILRVWSPEQKHPLLSIFIADRDWIAWTPEGYYACSAYGERLMGWQINQGTEQLAAFHPAARFRRSLYHPDVLPQVLPSGGLAAALAKLGKGGDGPTHVTQVLPPEVSITSPTRPNVTQAHGKIEVEAEARSVGGNAVTAMRLLVNGRPFDGDKGIRAVPEPKAGKVRARWKVDLPSGQNYLTVQAQSAVNKGLSGTVVVENTSADGGPPALYILAVGVSEYDGDMKLNYAASDARAIVAAFEKHHGGTFREVKARVLTDKEATRQGIVEGMRWLGSVLTPRDVGIVFFSGHGTRDPAGNFSLVPIDVKEDDPAGTCISGEALKRALGNMPGRVIAMFDACHSGAAAERRGRTGRADDLARDLVTEDYGIVCMCSSLGEEFSMESTETRAGFFTLGLTEGLSGQADVNRDRTIHLYELEVFAALRVRQLTGGRQNPVTGRPASFPSFPLARPG